MKVLMTSAALLVLTSAAGVSREHVRAPANAYAAADQRSSTQESQQFTDQERLWYKRVDQR